MTRSLILILSHAFFVFSTKSYAGQKVLRILVNTTDQLNAVNEVFRNVPENSISLWTGLNVGHPVDIMASEVAFPILVKGLAAIKYTVIIKDVQQVIESLEQTMVDPEIRVAGNDTPPRVPTEKEIFSNYYTPDTYVSYLSSLSGTTKFCIGKTYNSVDIFGVKFGSGPKNIIITGGIHAREWLSYYK
jgi:hypothetical protein